MKKIKYVSINILIKLLLGLIILQIFGDSILEMLFNNNPMKWKMMVNNSIYAISFILSIVALYYSRNQKAIIEKLMLSEKLLLENEQRYKSLFERNPDCVYTLDLAGVFRKMNPSSERMFGLKNEELHHLNFKPTVSKEDDERVLEHLKLVKQGIPQDYELTFIKNENTNVILSVTNLPIVIHDKIVGIYGISKDITEKKKIEQKLAKVQEDLQNTIKLQNGITFKLEKAKNNIIFTLCEGELLRRLGFTREQILDHTFLKLISPEFANAIGYYSKLAWNGEDYLSFEGRHNGIDFLVSLRPVLIEGSVQNVIGYCTDITNLKKAEQKIIHLVNSDELTNMPNRRHFKEKVEQAIEIHESKQTHLAILFIDLDNFKRVNDTLGHDAGDELICQVVHVVNSQITNRDVIARIGGDEFAILIERFSNEKIHKEANRIAESINRSFEKPIIIAGNDISVTASIGISLFPYDGTSLDELMKHADMAMYHAKGKGKNNHQFFHQELKMKLTEKMEMEKYLRKAIENNELVLHYQPKMDLKLNAMTSVEALIRWNHPDKGVVSPTKFIPLAEETGLIVPIGAWVLYTACLQNKQWQDEGFEPLRVSVNLSTVQFNQKYLLDKIVKILQETGLEPQYLELEITESMMMDVEQSLEKLNQLKALGVQISIDDFGTGYSSLNYLKNFSIDTLKIDQSFVRDCTTNEKDAAMIKTIIEMAHNLGIKVIAEGVETEEQLSFLKQQFSDEAQGYLFSKPLPSDELETLLKKNSKV